MDQLEGKVALVTGGASGIGLAMVTSLAASGMRVVMADIEEAALASAHDSFSDTNAEVLPVKLDVTDGDQFESVVEETEREVGDVAVLCNNAGVSAYEDVPAWELPINDWRWVFDVNIMGVVHGIKAFVPGMIAHGEAGAVMNTSSGNGGLLVLPFTPSYSASKAAVQALALALRNELHSFGIGVSLVEPGDIRTGFNEAMEWSDSRTSAYADQAGRTEQVIRESLPDAPGPEVVARTIHRALTARHPRVRYSVGTESTLVAVGSRLFPDWFSLALIRNHFRI